jgi:hypothetical protein
MSLSKMLDLRHLNLIISQIQSNEHHPFRMSMWIIIFFLCLILKKNSIFINLVTFDILNMFTRMSTPWHLAWHAHENNRSSIFFQNPWLFRLLDRVAVFLTWKNIWTVLHVFLIPHISCYIINLLSLALSFNPVTLSLSHIQTIHK